MERGASVIGGIVLDTQHENLVQESGIHLYMGIHKGSRIRECHRD